ncbi:putative pre-16S rRNA nuclease [Alphaproteobacteria bacterium]|nr:putative pre-16S rRNA nuclease [Alphaproteobacteria bacterium]
MRDLGDIQIEDLNRHENVIVCLDVGDKTIGIAVSDRRNKIASPIVTIARKGNKNDLDVLLKCTQPYKIGLIIFGWPILMSGTASKQCRKVADFANWLAKYMEIDFAKWDERFSTSVVDKIMIEADLSRKRRKQVIDKTAATYILQGALDFLNRPVAKASWSS